MELKITLYILFNFWATASGAAEAVLWSKKGSEAFKWNEHIILTIQRIACGLLFLAGFYGSFLICYSLLDLLLFGVMMLSFPFFHDGGYYETRKRIDMPTYNWWSNSSTSTALLELTITSRVLLLILSLILLFV